MAQGADIGSTLGNIAGYGVGTIGALLALRHGQLQSTLIQRAEALANPDVRAGLGPFSAGALFVPGGMQAGAITPGPAGQPGIADIPSIGARKWVPDLPDMGAISGLKEAGAQNLLGYLQGHPELGGEWARHQIGLSPDEGFSTPQEAVAAVGGEGFRHLTAQDLAKFAPLYGITYRNTPSGKWTAQTNTMPQPVAKGYEQELATGPPPPPLPAYGMGSGTPPPAATAPSGMPLPLGGATRPPVAAPAQVQPGGAAPTAPRAQGLDPARLAEMQQKADAQMAAEGLGGATGSGITQPGTAGMARGGVLESGPDKDLQRIEAVFRELHGPSSPEPWTEGQLQSAVMESHQRLTKNNSGQLLSWLPMVRADFQNYLKPLVNPRTGTLFPPIGTDANGQPIYPRMIDALADEGARGVLASIAGRTMTGEAMHAMRNFGALPDWQKAAIDALEGQQSRIILHARAGGDASRLAQQEFERQMNGLPGWKDTVPGAEDKALMGLRMVTQFERDLIAGNTVEGSVSRPSNVPEAGKWHKLPGGGWMRYTP